MTVIEIIKKYGLEDYDKHYKNVYGNSCDLEFSIEELAKKKVKAIDINFPTEEVAITIL